jgi:hypothetical protein
LESLCRAVILAHPTLSQRPAKAGTPTLLESRLQAARPFASKKTG